MKKIIFFPAFLFSYFSTLLFPLPVLAAAKGCVTELTDPTTKITYKDVPSLGCLADTIMNLINFLLGMIAAVTLIFLLIGILRLIISQGDPKALDGAKKTITYALLGFLIVFFSALIINFVTGAFGLPNTLKNFTFYQSQ